MNKLMSAVIDKLDSISFHDIGISGFLEKGTNLDVFLEIFNEDSNLYDILMLQFVRYEFSLKSDSIPNITDETELYKFNYKYTNCFECELVILQGFAKPSSSIKFKCEMINIS
jgi:hypothetical protein